MTVDEIFAEVSAHMIKGLMIHTQLADYYDFLGLQGYKRCHEYHALKESCSYRGINRYFINHYNKLVPEKEIENPDIIPENWYRYTRQDVDANTKRNAVKSGLEKWVEWEQDTKKFYEQMYVELMNLQEVSGALKMKELICDVDQELKKAQRYHLNKMATDYNINSIISEQGRKHKKYKKKLEKEIGVRIC